ncbi:MAG: class I SAM-dependent methyltransferase [Pseudomonadales bacterium]
MTLQQYTELPSALTVWIEKHLGQALAEGEREVRRLFHGRAGEVSGFKDLVIDWLPPVAVVRLYAEMPEAALSQLADFLAAKPEIKGAVLQHRGRGTKAQNSVLFGEVDTLLEVAEEGLRYEVAPLAFQNSGLFLDMRNGRRWLRERAAGANVLNLFAYSCGFSVAAVAGGAQQVVNVDISKRALSMGRRNHQLNAHPKSATQFMPYDMLKSWSRIAKPGPYDIVVIDPPSFQPGSFIAQKDYAKVLRRLVQLTTPGASVVACHNDPAQSSDFVRQLMAEHCPQFHFVQMLPVPEDFAEADLEKALKVMIFERSADTSDQ